MKSQLNRVGHLMRGRLVCMALAVILAGCASASVTPDSSAPAPAIGTARPTRIVVDDFAFSASQVTENSAIGARVLNSFSSTTTGQRENQIGKQASDALAAEIVKQLDELGFIVVTGDKSTQLADGDMLIGGEFVNVDEGNRLRRLVIGFGAGASKLDTRVNVYRVVAGVQQPLMQFTTHADSGKMPGAALTMGAGAAAQGGATAGMAAANVGMGGAKTYTSQVEYLSDKTANQTVAYLSQYFAQQGWISPDQAQKVKLSDAP
ncbi:MAG: DUF4410 domain-containing protein [Candidatus Binataceae bacterium]